MFVDLHVQFISCYYMPHLNHRVSRFRLLYQVTLHIAYVHAFVNPALFLALHRGLRQGMSDVCCGCCESIARWILGSTATSPIQNITLPRYEAPMNLPSPPGPPLAAPVAPSGCNLTDVALLKPPLPPTAKHLLVVGHSAE